MSKTSTGVPAPKQALVRDLLYLCGCAVRETVPDLSLVSSELGELLDFAAFHVIRAPAATALSAAGVRDARVTHAMDVAVRNTLLFAYETAELEKRLEAAGIWYVLLKGARLKDFYPRAEMRQMSDRDILMDPTRREDVRAILLDMGYEIEEYGGVLSYHDVYRKPPVFCFEMHRLLFHPLSDFYAYYKNVKDRLLPAGGCEYRFTDEDFYLYTLAHEYKHYAREGTGLRSLLDLYVMLTRMELDFSYIEREAEKLGIAAFERQNRELARSVFEGRPLDEAQREMLDYLARCGVYGHRENIAKHRVERADMGRLAYVLHRLSVPVSRKNPYYIYFEEQYPLFYRHRVLLPLLPLYRVFRSIRRGEFGNEAKMVREKMGKH